MEYTSNYALRLTDVKTYAFAVAFIAGNILLPQLCHLVPQGGLIFLPIYFFTLIGAYCYGRNVGMLSAILSPLVNCAFFGMPPVAALPAIMIKSAALALIASYISERKHTVTLPLLLLTVVGYQVVGMSFEFVQGLARDYSAADSFTHALQDVRIGYPGLLTQLFFGYLLIKKLSR